MKYELIMKIREIRESRNMSQEELAEKAGISQVILDRAENGDMDITLDILVLIGNALGLSSKDLFDEI